MNKIASYLISIFALAGCYDPQIFEDVPPKQAERQTALESIGATISGLPSASEQDLIGFSKHPDMRVRAHAAEKLAQYAPHSELASKTLAALASTDNADTVRTKAIIALAQSGHTVGHEAVVRALCDENHHVNKYAEKTLNKLASRASEALLNALSPAADSASGQCKNPNYTNKTVNQRVISYLMTLESNVVPLLTPGLSHHDQHVVVRCLTLLGDNRNAAAPALGDITALMYNSGNQTRMAAINAMIKIGDLHPSVMPSLHDATKDENKQIAQTATRALQILRNPQPTPSRKRRPAHRPGRHR